MQTLSSVWWSMSCAPPSSSTTLKNPTPNKDFNKSGCFETIGTLGSPISPEGEWRQSRQIMFSIEEVAAFVIRLPGRARLLNRMHV